LLAFGATNGNKPDIWVQQIGGAEALRVTNDPLGAFKPRLSADGTRLLYESARSGGEIYETPALRSEPRFITRGYCPQYAVDGSKVVFLRSGDRSLAIAPLSGGAPVSLGESFAVDSRASSIYGWCGFAVSPDGKRVLVRGHRQGHDADRSRWWLVSLLNATWQQIDPPGHAASDTYSPFLETWTRIGNTPGKEWVVFGRWTSPWFYDFEGSSAGESRDLFRATLSIDGRITSEPERLTFAPGSAAGARVSESGKMVFHNQQWRAALLTIPLDGSSGPQGIAAQDLFRLEGARGIAPSISRDGSKVAYWHGKRVAVRDLQTGHERRLTSELQPVPATGPIISPDGKLVAYYAPTGEQDIRDLYVVSAEGGAARKIGNHLGEPKGFSADGRRIITQLRSGSANQLAVVDLLDGDVKAVLKDPKHALWNGFYSWDDKWITFLRQLDAFQNRVYITPVENGVPAAEDRWIPLTSGEYFDNKPQLSPDGNTVYFTSNRDGSHCIWAQRLHPRTKHPVGPPVPVRQMHEHIAVLSPEISVARRMILIAVSDIRSDIWMIDLAGSN
jgi:Tol biopolymer transport system component